ncbi:MAG: carbohydrate ABC transporter permease [Clostridiales bacterium]|nr:carbohydrate ABC transporter permease [Clostridiales bacterium]
MAKNGKRLNRSVQVDIAIIVVLCVFAAFMVMPLIFAIASSFKPMSEIFIFPPKFFPMKPTFQNYRDLFSLMSNSWVPFSRYGFNTIFITLAGTAGHIVFASMCAYPLALKKFPGGKGFFNLILLALMFSGAVTTVPNYMTMAKLGWVDTYWPVIAPYLASPLGLFLMKPFIEQNVPISLIESAQTEGVSEWQIFWRIVMPLVKPAWLTLIVFSVQNLWSMGNSMYIYDEQLKTLNFAMSQIVSGGIARAGVGSAVSVIMMSVPIAVFVIAQTNVVETMATSGIKE